MSNFQDEIVSLSDQQEIEYYEELEDIERLEQDE